MTERHARDESMEDLLRAALASRADSVTLGSLRPPGPPTAKDAHRSRRTRVGVPLGILAAVAAAFGGVSLIGAPRHQAGAPAQGPMSVSALPTAERTAAPEAPAQAAPTTSVPRTTAPPVDPDPDPDSPSTSERTRTSPPPSRTGTPSTSTTTRPVDKTFGAQAIKVNLPAGWHEQAGEADSGGVRRSRCFLAAGTSGSAVTCDLNSVEIRVDELDGPARWSYATTIDRSPYGYATQPICAKDGRLVVLKDTETITAKVVTKEKRTVGGRGAEYRVVSVTCAGGQNFKVRTWSIVDQGIEIMATGADAGTEGAIDSLIASIDATGFKPRPYSAR
ncbi:hypothetical protein ACIBSV_19845 [Embleya sp. NPDC050154]|uniref:hypothetical protein n=1 Tax=unclassified Embleya TaxID=2699296 RepID=UPI0037899FF9